MGAGSSVAAHCQAALACVWNLIDPTSRGFLPLLWLAAARDLSKASFTINAHRRLASRSTPFPSPRSQHAPWNVGQTASFGISGSSLDSHAVRRQDSPSTSDSLLSCMDRSSLACAPLGALPVCVTEPRSRETDLWRHGAQSSEMRECRLVRVDVVPSRRPLHLPQSQALPKRPTWHRPRTARSPTGIMSVGVGGKSHPLVESGESGILLCRRAHTSSKQDTM